MNGNKNSFIIVAAISIIVLTVGLLFSCKNKEEQQTKKMVELGRYLFYDRRLSVNNTKACGTCHNPSFAFTDGYKRSLGVYADLHQRNTEPLFNLQYLKYFTAADSSLRSTIQQMNNPLFNLHPQEMGVKGHETEILQRIQSDKNYQQLFSAAFHTSGNIVSWDNIRKSISSFINTIVSDQSAYDHYLAGDTTALSAAQKKGKELFFSTRLKCSSCHGGFNFSSPVIRDNKGDTVFYFNTGLYNVDGKGTYPEYDMGLYQFTKSKADMGKFRVPTLRNLIFTTPYFHDGSAVSLDQVIDVYAAGGRNIQEGEYAGNGVNNPYKDTLISGFTITAEEKKNLLFFLQSLTDSALIKSRQYGNPFTEDETEKKY